MDFLQILGRNRLPERLKELEFSSQVVSKESGTQTSFHFRKITEYHLNLFCKSVIHSWCPSGQDRALSYPLHHLELLPWSVQGLLSDLGVVKILIRPESGMAQFHVQKTLKDFHCPSQGTFIHSLPFGVTSLPLQNPDFLLGCFRGATGKSSKVQRVSEGRLCSDMYMSAERYFLLYHFYAHLEEGKIQGTSCVPGALKGEY